MTIITFVLFLSLALSHSAPCTFSLTLSFHLSFSYILLSPLLSFTLYPYLFPLALLLNDSLSLSPRYAAAVGKEGQSEQLSAQRLQPAQRAYGLARTRGPAPARRERPAPAPRPATAQPACSPGARRWHHPEEARPLQNMGPVPEHV